MKNFSFSTGVFLILIVSFSLNQQVIASSSVKPNEEGPWPSLEVNTYTGNLFYQRSDLQIPALGDIDLSVIFSFNSLNTDKDHGYGNGWSFSFGMQYSISDSTFTISRGDGEEYKFILSYKVYGPGQPHWGNISEYSPGKYLHTTKYGIRYYFDDPLHKKLTEIKDRNGNSTLITYAGGLPVTITDPSEREINLFWSDGHLSQITYSHTTPGRVIEFQYDGSGNMVQVTRPLSNTFQYVYDSNKYLISVTDPLLNVVNISYGLNGAVEGMNCPAASYNKTFQYDICTSTTTVSQMVSLTNRQTIYTFNLDGQVILRQHPDENFEEYEWDSLNNLLSYTDENGSSSTFAYDTCGNMLSATDCLGNADFYTYDSNFNMVTQHIDKSGNATNYSYDLYGNLISITDCMTNIQGIECDAYGNITGKTDQNGNTTNFSYDIYGNLTGLTDPLGFTESYTYDQAGNLLTSTDKRGFTNTYTYDLLDRHTGSTDAGGFTSIFAYDSNGNLTSETNANGFTTTYVYDVLDRLISQTDGLGGVTSYTYDEAGNLLTETNANGCTETYTYNLRNKRSTHVDDPGHIDYVSYDPVGNILSTTDKNGNTTNYSYDCLGQLTSLTDPNGYTESYMYDANGNEASVTNKNGNTTTYYYDCLNQHISTSFPLGYTESFAYDAVGRRTSYTNKNGDTSAYSFDALGRLTLSSDPLSFTQTFTYDGEGNLTGFTDQEGKTTTYTYDGLGRRLSVTDPLSYTESYTYDNIGNRLSVTDKRGNSTNFSYDGLNRMVIKTDPNGCSESYTYDPVGNETSFTGKNGNTTTYTYDCNNQKISLTDPLGYSESFSYSPVGNQTGHTGKTGNTTTWNYSCCRLTSITDPLGYTESYSYDQLGNITGSTNENGFTTTYSYDDLNRLTSIITPMLHQTSYTYDGVGNALTRTDANLNTTNYTYNARNELISKQYPDSTGINYSYDGRGNLTQIINTGGISETTTYYYDDNNRLVSKSTNFGLFSKTINYTYDQNGNNSSVIAETGTITYQYDAENRIALITDQASGVTAFEYDCAGNQTVIHHPNGVSTLTSYDAMDRIIEVDISDTPLAIPANSPAVKKAVHEPERLNQLLLYIDVAVTQILTPVSGPGLSESEPVTIELINLGAEPVFDAPVSYSIDGNEPVVESVPIPLLPGEPVLYIFLQTADLSIPGQTYLITACVTAPNDEDPANNCMDASIQNESLVVYQSFNYQYDPVGNITQVIAVEEGPSITDFEYSARNELLQEEFMSSGNLNLYTYTPSGQRASLNKDGDLAVYSYNNDGMLISAGAVSFIPDANGNRLSMIEADGITDYSYGYENELKSVTLPDLSYTHFDYTALLIKIRENENGVFRYLHTDDGKILETFDAAGVPVSNYNPGLSINLGSLRGFYYYNGFASSTLQLDQIRNILATTTYDAFGNVTETTGAWVDDRSIFRSWSNYTGIGLHDRGRGSHIEPERGNKVNGKGNGIDFGGADLSEVKVHTDKAAGEASSRMGASAFARGSDIAFGDGKNGPRDILSSELAHSAGQTDRHAAGKADDEPGTTKPPVVTDGNPEAAQGEGNKDDEKKKNKCCGVKSFAVEWEKRADKRGRDVGFRINVSIEFLDDDKHDPVCCYYCQNVSTVLEVKNGPNRGRTINPKEGTTMREDNYSRADDGNNKFVRKRYTTNDLPNWLRNDDDLDYAFTAEQIVRERCGSPCPTGSVVAQRGPHTGTLKGRAAQGGGYTSGGVPKTLDGGWLPNAEIRAAPPQIFIK